MVEKMNEKKVDTSSLITIRNNFIRCSDGTWINLNFVGELWISKDKDFEDFYLNGRFFGSNRESDEMKYKSYDFEIKIFTSRKEAQKCLDELMGIRVEDFTPLWEYEFTVRTRNALNMLGCKTIGDAKKIRRLEWYQTPGVSIKSWDELQNVLDQVYGER